MLQVFVSSPFYHDLLTIKTKTNKNKKLVHFLYFVLNEILILYVEIIGNFERYE